MASTVRLSDEQRSLAKELFDEFYPTIEATAAQAKSSWCAAYEFDDLIQEGFDCLLSVAGMLGTSGKYDPNRLGQNGKKPATFKTYLITSLRNKYRDMGTAQGAHAKRIRYVDEYVEVPTQSKSEEDEPDGLKLGRLWETLSPVERVILDVRTCSYPEKVPLTQIAHLLQLPYDRVLMANASLKSKVETSQYNPSLVHSTSDCFGLYPDESVAECASCVDLEACKRKHATEEGSEIKIGESQMFTDDGGGASSVATAPAVEAPKAAPAFKRTMMDVAFERLVKGPASKDELIKAIQAEMPDNKGTRAFDLMAILKLRSLTTELEPIEEQAIDDAGVSKTVKVKRIQLNEGAVQLLADSQELTYQQEPDGIVKYHLKLKQ